MAQAIRLHELFSTQPAARFLAAVPPVPETVDLTSWRRRFRALTVGVRNMHVGGGFTLTRRPAPEGFQLQVEFLKLAVRGFENLLRATIVCADDRLGTPVSWQFEIYARDSKEKAVNESTRWRQRGRKTATGYTVEEAGTTRNLPVAGNATINWVIPAIVGGLPKEPGPPIPLTLLDDFDHVKPGLELRCRGTRDVSIGGKQEAKEREVKLERGTVFRPEKAWVGGSLAQVTRYDLTGPGLVPRVYYVDQAGRLLCIAAGTEMISFQDEVPIPAQEEK
jgi:hypothetical protein